MTGYITQTLLSAAGETGAGNAVDTAGFNIDKAQVQIEGITTATVKIEGSIDGTNFYTISFLDIRGSSPVAGIDGDTGITADTVQELVSVPRYIRANVTAFTAGSITVLLGLRTK